MKADNLFKTLTMIICCFPFISAVGQSLHFRAYPSGNNVFRCMITNTTDRAFAVDCPLLINWHNIQATNLEDESRFSYDIGPYVETEEEIDYLDTIPPQEGLAYFVPTSMVDRCFVISHFSSLYWYIENHRSNKLVCSLNHECDNSPCPATGTTSTEIILALHRWTEGRNDSDVGFLVMNGSNTAVTVGQPLFNDSRLVVHSPKIGYSNEVFAVDSSATNATVAARGTTEWRVPWTNLWNRLPAADRARLTEAHEVDLFWKTPAFTSDALPLWLE